MSDKDFLIKYEELLNKDYCNCNEMNCIDNNSPRRILNIAKQLQEENQQLKEQIKDIDMWNKKYNEEFDKNKLLEHNWNKLKEYIKKAYYNGERIDTKEIIEYMQELERGVSDVED